jgi:hypothetical protein
VFLVVKRFLDLTVEIVVECLVIRVLSDSSLALLQIAILVKVGRAVRCWRQLSISLASHKLSDNQIVLVIHRHSFLYQLLLFAL